MVHQNAERDQKLLPLSLLGIPTANIILRAGLQHRGKQYKSYMGYLRSIILCQPVSVSNKENTFHPSTTNNQMHHRPLTHENFIIYTHPTFSTRNTFQYCSMKSKLNSSTKRGIYFIIIKCILFL